MSQLILRQIETDELPQATAMLAVLNAGVGEVEVSHRLWRIPSEHQHDQLFGAHDGGGLVGLCGAWIGGAWIAIKLWCGCDLEVDNLVVAPAHRARGAWRGEATKEIHFVKMMGQGTQNLMAA